jgi:LiaI-LiaF-like transmembrane region
MKCAIHSEVDAAGYCRQCGKPMCTLCARHVKGALYCEDCLVKLLGTEAPGAAPAKHLASRPHPILAFFLGFIPGLGAFYNEQYGKGIFHLALFLFLFTAGVNGRPIGGGVETALWLCIIALWIYMPVDAYRVAKDKCLGETPSDPFDSLGKERLIGPFLLIFFGVLLLFHNFGLFSLHLLFRLWPIVLILVGLLMFRERLTGGS